MTTATARSGGSARRVYAMLLRHLYILRGSVPRLLELTYWPTMQMIIWGFMSTFLAGNSSWVAEAGGVLLAAVMLWDVLFRGQLGLSLSFRAAVATLGDDEDHRHRRRRQSHVRPLARPRNPPLVDLAEPSPQIHLLPSGSTGTVLEDPLGEKLTIRGGADHRRLG